MQYMYSISTFSKYVLIIFISKGQIVKWTLAVKIV
jgi:hypothetical protein